MKVGPPGQKRHNKRCGHLANVAIAGKTMEIHRVKDPKNDEGESVWGTCSIEDRRIEIAYYLNDEDELETLGHELAHASLKLYYTSNKFTEDEEEHFADVIGAGLTAGLKPWLKRIGKVSAHLPKPPKGGTK